MYASIMLTSAVLCINIRNFSRGALRHYGEHWHHHDRSKYVATCKAATDNTTDTTDKIR